jgi:hypothetical protein
MRLFIVAALLAFRLADRDCTTTLLITKIAFPICQRTSDNGSIAQYAMAQLSLLMFGL